MLVVSHGSVRRSKLHSLKVFRFFVSTASSSILFGSKFMFSMIMEGTGGLNLHFVASCLALSLAPALQLQYGFLTSTGNGGTTSLLDFSLRTYKKSVE